MLYKLTKTCFRFILCSDQRGDPRKWEMESGVHDWRSKWNVYSPTLQCFQWPLLCTSCRV